MSHISITAGSLWKVTSHGWFVLIHSQGEKGLWLTPDNADRLARLLKDAARETRRSLKQQRAEIDATHNTRSQQVKRKVRKTQ